MTPGDTVAIKPSSLPWLIGLLEREAHQANCVCSSDWKYPERPCDCCAAFDLLTQISAEWKKGLIAVENENSEECPHDDHDHGMCLDCGLDRTDHFVSAAEYVCEGER